MRIASVEQIELGNIMELSITGQVLRWARHSNLSGGLSLRKADGWNLKNHSHQTVARHLREKTHPSMLVVTIREGEERGICSVALRELSGAVKDQIEERSVVVIVSNRESAIWKNASVKIVLQENQLKYVGIEGMRVVTNNRFIAEQIKSDKVENVVMDGSKIGKFRKIERQQNLKSIVLDGVRSGEEDEVKNVVMDGVKKWKSWTIAKLTRRCGAKARRDCASRS